MHSTNSRSIPTHFFSYAHSGQIRTTFVSSNFSRTRRSTTRLIAGSSPPCSKTTNCRRCFQSKIEFATSRMLYSSAGRGGSCQKETLPTVLLSNAYTLMRLRGHVSLNELTSSLEVLVASLRSAIRGDATTVPAFVGFNNIATAPDSEIALPWGSTRSYRDVGLDVIPRSVRPGEVDGTLSGFVLETAVPFVVAVMEQEGADHLNDGWPVKTTPAKSLTESPKGRSWLSPWRSTALRPWRVRPFGS